MKFLFLLLTAITLFFITSNKEKCINSNIINNLQNKVCYYTTAFSIKYSVDVFDIVSGETGKSGKLDSITEAMDKATYNLYEKNTIGYNCKYLKDLYNNEYKVRHCYFYPDNDLSYKIIVSKSGLLTEGMYVSKNVDKRGIELAIKDYKEKEGKSLCW
jgi:hypothetical protein